MPIIDVGWGGYIANEDGSGDIVLAEDGTKILYDAFGVTYSELLGELGFFEVPTIADYVKTTTGIGGYLLHNEGFNLTQQDTGLIILSDPEIPAWYIGEMNAIEIPTIAEI